MALKSRNLTQVKIPMKQVTKSDSQFETAPEGNFPAVITVVADLGIQKSTWDGVERYQRRIGISYELQLNTNGDSNETE